VAEFPFKQFMMAVAKTSLLSDLEAQRGQDLDEARAIQGSIWVTLPERASGGTVLGTGCGNIARRS